MARTMPTRTIVPGSPSRRIPAPTGMSAARTPVIGATTPIRPTDRPWYSAVMPTPPATAATALHATSPASKSVSPTASARTSAMLMPTTCDTSTTPKTGVRRDRSPPPKSPPPQTTAENRPRRTVAMDPDPSGSGRHGRDGRSRSERVEDARTVEDDDGVGSVVVARRAGEIDDLEIRCDRPQQVERAGRPGVVERHEGIVEHERRPAVTRDESNQSEARDEEHDVEGALAQ